MRWTIKVVAKQGLAAWSQIRSYAWVYPDDDKRRYPTACIAILVERTAQPELHAAAGTDPSLSEVQDFRPSNRRRLCRLVASRRLRRHNVETVAQILAAPFHFSSQFFSRERCKGRLSQLPPGSSEPFLQRTHVLIDVSHGQTSKRRALKS